MLTKICNLLARVFPVDYDEYLLSIRWRKKADKCKKIAGNCCQLCSYDRNLQAHHRTYDRLGYELMSDLTCLCGYCHQAFHNWRKQT